MRRRSASGCRGWAGLITLVWLEHCQHRRSARLNAFRVLARTHCCSGAATRSNREASLARMKSIWWGKLAGGTLGLVAGGWLGALIGVVLGHQLDEGIVRELGEDEDETLADNSRIQLEFFTTTFSVMGHLAKADGRLWVDEIAAARGVMRRMKLTSEQTTAAIRLFTEGKRADFPLSSVLQSFRACVKGRRDVLHTFVEIQLQAALA